MASTATYSLDDNAWGVFLKCLSHNVRYEIVVSGTQSGDEAKPPVLDEWETYAFRVRDTSRQTLVFVRGHGVGRRLVVFMPQGFCSMLFAPRPWLDLQIHLEALLLLSGAVVRGSPDSIFELSRIDSETSERMESWRTGQGKSLHYYIGRCCAVYVSDRVSYLVRLKRQRYVFLRRSKCDALETRLNRKKVWPASTQLVETSHEMKG
jgi:hypothetical protein